MSTPTARRSLALDLIDTDLRVPDSLSRLVIDHTIAPLRALCGLSAPRSGEGRAFMFEPAGAIDGIPVESLRPMDLPKSASTFDTVVRSLLLFGWLFPGSALVSEGVDFILDAPGTAAIDDYWHLVDRPAEAIEDLVAGLLGEPTRRLPWHGSRPHTPARNDAALAELDRAKDLVSRALGPVEDDGSTVLVDLGLDRIDWLLARDIDKVLHEDVRRRLVCYGTFEPVPVRLLNGSIDSDGGILTWDRGVFAAEVPDTLTGLVLLDFSEQLGRDRSAAVCAHCGGLFAVNTRQAGRARQGMPVYHADCRDEHRLGYFRRKSRARYTRSREGVIA